jgi:predicted transcriptional regulator
MSLEELSNALGIDSSALNLHLQGLLQGELVVVTNGRITLTELGASLLEKMGAKEGMKGENERK